VDKRTSARETKVVPRLKQSWPHHFIAEWREFRGLTQEQLAGRVDLSVSSISQLENGKQGYSQPTLEALAVALSCEPGDLLMRNPMDKNAPWSLLASLKPESREKVVDYIRMVARADGVIAA
jgi:transcriptional regulator with XRE-family HTH domain